MGPREKANHWLSMYIRLRDAIKFQKSHGVDIVGIQPDLITVQCCSCPFIGGWRYNMDCGHYFGRSTGGGQSALIYHEDNNHAQCTNCNRTQAGNLGQYKIFMINKFGEDKLNEMEQQNRQITDMSGATLLAIADHYKGLYEGLLELF